MSANIGVNKKASFTYHLHEEFEAGLVLQGWEVKSLRQKKCQLHETYVLLKNNELWLINMAIPPLVSASTHKKTDTTRLRKLLLHRKQIDSIIGAISKKGMTCVLTRLYWKGQHIKCNLRLATGKKLHDKRHSIKDREWTRDKERLMKTATRSRDNA